MVTIKSFLLLYFLLHMQMMIFVLFSSVICRMILVIFCSVFFIKVRLVIFMFSMVIRSIFCILRVVIIGLFKGS